MWAHACRRGRRCQGRRAALHRWHRLPLPRRVVGHGCAVTWGGLWVLRRLLLKCGRLFGALHDHGREWSTPTPSGCHVCSFCCLSTHRQARLRCCMRLNGRRGAASQPSSPPMSPTHPRRYEPASTLKTSVHGLECGRCVNGLLERVALAGMSCSHWACRGALREPRLPAKRHHGLLNPTRALTVDVSYAQVLFDRMPKKARMVVPNTPHSACHSSKLSPRRCSSIGCMRTPTPTRAPPPLAAPSGAPM